MEKVQIEHGGGAGEDFSKLGAERVAEVHVGGAEADGVDAFVAGNGASR